jgi:prolyl-tRNA editing enzyme YbaK/EbsC (Cys-tRNA(Pro) deacylase)
MDDKVARVIAAGAERGLVIEPVTFEKGTRTSQDAADAVGCKLGQIVKSLVFEAEGKPVLFLMSGANRVDLAKGAIAAGVALLTKADADGVKKATGYSIGATPPLGHATELDIFMDEDLLGYPVVWAAAGRADSVFPCDPGALARAAGVVVLNLKEGEESAQ